MAKSILLDAAGEVLPAPPPVNNAQLLADIVELRRRLGITIQWCYSVDRQITVVEKAAKALGSQ